MRRLSGIVIAAMAVAGVARAEIIDGIAAVVNGNVITLSEVVERAGSALPPGDAAGEVKARRDSMIKHATEDLVTEKLVQTECKAQSLEPGQTEIDEAIDNVQRQNHIDRPTLEGAIKAQGMTMTRYREMLVEQLCRMKVVEMKVKNRVTITDDDVKAELAKQHATVTVSEEMKIRDILIPIAQPDAKKRIEQAKSRIAQGVDFAQAAFDAGGPLAHKTKDGLPDLARSGDLGWNKQADLLPAFQPVVEKLPKGGISDIIVTKDAYHLLKVEDRRTVQDVQSMTEQREKIRSQLMEEKLQKATEDYIAELKRAADIQYKL